jgi:Tol biopolymer transport system component
LDGDGDWSLSKSFDPPASIWDVALSWSPDGRALVYVLTKGDVSNLWQQPLDGGAPKQITNFNSGRIWNFAYSRDGRQLALARGEMTHDAVLISDVK